MKPEKSKVKNEIEQLIEFAIQKLTITIKIDGKMVARKMFIISRSNSTSTITFALSLTLLNTQFLIVYMLTLGGPLYLMKSSTSLIVPFLLRSLFAMIIEHF